MVRITVKNTITWFWYLILVLTETAKIPDCTERTSVKELVFRVPNPGTPDCDQTAFKTPLALELRKHSE